jgi:hypothetical protein
MSIGLVIANIGGSVRQLPPVSADVLSVPDKNPSGSAAPEAVTPSASREPASGQTQLTPGFTVVVLQLLNEQGAVVSTIPSAQQLAAYRKGTATPPP